MICKVAYFEFCVQIIFFLLFIFVVRIYILGLLCLSNSATPRLSLSRSRGGRRVSLTLFLFVCLFVLFTFVWCWRLKPGELCVIKCVLYLSWTSKKFVMENFGNIATHHISCLMHQRGSRFSVWQHKPGEQYDDFNII